MTLILRHKIKRLVNEKVKTDKEISRKSEFPLILRNIKEEKYMQDFDIRKQAKYKENNKSFEEHEHRQIK